MLHLESKRLLAAATLTAVLLVIPLSAEEPKKVAKPSDKMRHRLEQLFVWRVADRLSLTTQEEAKFNEEFTKLAHEKAELSQKLESLLEKIEEKKNDTKVAVGLLSEYQTAMKKYNDLQTKEMQVLGRILSPRKMVDYVLLKREMTQKFKDVLVQGSRRGPENASLKDPEVIQEK